MSDKFEGRARSFDGPANDGFSVTPNDVAALAEITRAIYVGTAGNISLTLTSGAALTFINVPSGTLLPVRATEVKSTGTTATDLIGLL